MRLSRMILPVVSVALCTVLALADDKSLQVSKHFPGYRRGSQSLQSNDKRAFDVLEFTTADGKKRTIYFDITDFFGK